MKFWQAECPNPHGSSFQQNLSILTDNGVRVEIVKAEENNPYDKANVQTVISFGGDTSFAIKPSYEEALEAAILSADWLRKDLWPQK